MNYRWKLSDLNKVEKNGKTVFSCFSCGGGSTMGYKLAGYEVLGNNEIDEKTNAIYKANHHPKYSFNMDIRDMVKVDDLPKELYDLDVLDGSPPCTSFSMAGDREKAWGKEKKFAEGNVMQKLDDLFFPFIELGKKLQPKVIVAENVEGLLNGNAKGYVHEILTAFDQAGYEVQLFKLNAATMGVPQKRVRVFFVARRKDLNLPKLKLSFNEKPICFGEYRSDKGVMPSKHEWELLSKRKKNDKKLADINLRLRNKNVGFTSPIVWDDDVCPTVASAGSIFRGADGMAFSDEDIILTQSFPLDYDFKGGKPKFYCGMSVPPIMMFKIAEQIYQQLLKKD